MGTCCCSQLLLPGVQHSHCPWALQLLRRHPGLLALLRGQPGPLCPQSWRWAAAVRPTHSRGTAAAPTAWPSFPATAWSAWGRMVRRGCGTWRAPPVCTSCGWTPKGRTGGARRRAAQPCPAGNRRSSSEAVSCPAGACRGGMAPSPCFSLPPGLHPGLPPPPCRTRRGHSVNHLTVAPGGKAFACAAGRLVTLFTLGPSAQAEPSRKVLGPLESTVRRAGQILMLCKPGAAASGQYGHGSHGGSTAKSAGTAWMLEFACISIAPSPGHCHRRCRPSAPLLRRRWRACGLTATATCWPPTTAASATGSSTGARATSRSWRCRMRGPACAATSRQVGDPGRRPLRRGHRAACRRVRQPCPACRRPPAPWHPQAWTTLWPAATTPRCTSTTSSGSGRAAWSCRQGRVGALTGVQPRWPTVGGVRCRRCGGWARWGLLRGLRSAAGGSLTSRPGPLNCALQEMTCGGYDSKVTAVDFNARGDRMASSGAGGTVVRGHSERQGGRDGAGSMLGSGRADEVLVLVAVCVCGRGGGHWRSRVSRQRAAPRGMCSAPVCSMQRRGPRLPPPPPTPLLPRSPLPTVGAHLAPSPLCCSRRRQEHGVELQRQPHRHDAHAGGGALRPHHLPGAAAVRSLPVPSRRCCFQALQACADAWRLPRNAVRCCWSARRATALSCPAHCPARLEALAGGCWPVLGHAGPRCVCTVKRQPER